jgi:hypothetical protein
MTDTNEHHDQETEVNPRSLGESIQAIIVGEPTNPPDIVEAMKAIEKHGVPVDSNSLPKAILGAWIGIFCGQQRMVKTYEDDAQACRDELEKTKKELKRCKDPDERDRLRSDLVYFRKVVFEYDKMRLTIGSKMGESGKDIIHLDGKIRQSTKDDGVTAVSWDPDAPAQPPRASVDVHIHGNAQVELRENKQ